MTINKNYTITNKQNKISYGMEFHKNGAATEKEYLNVLMVEDAMFKVKECIHAVNLLNLRYFCETASSCSI